MKNDLEDVKEFQNIFKTNHNEISKGRFTSEEQKSAFENIKLLYKSWEAAIKLCSNYPSIISEAKYNSIHGEGLKILTPKQMLQRLPIALTQIKAGNGSEDLLNEIRQIIYSLCRAKKIFKKVDNNIMNSIKV